MRPEPKIVSENDVPKELQEEITQLANQIVVLLMPLLKGKTDTVGTNAVGLAHACLFTMILKDFDFSQLSANAKSEAGILEGNIKKFYKRIELWQKKK